MKAARTVAQKRRGFEPWVGIWGDFEGAQEADWGGWRIQGDIVGAGNEVQRTLGQAGDSL